MKYCQLTSLLSGNPPSLSNSVRPNTPWRIAEAAVVPSISPSCWLREYAPTAVATRSFGALRDMPMNWPERMMPCMIPEGKAYSASHRLAPVRHLRNMTRYDRMQMRRAAIDIVL